MSAPIVYFAFGSNLHAPQMQARCPDGTVLQPAVLEGYRLAFRGHSAAWGGGVATILGAAGARVPGLLYRLSPADVQALNGYESYPQVYDHLPIQVTTADGAQVAALTYQRRDGAPRPPSMRYFHQIWRAYKHYRLDDHLLLEALQETLEHPAAGGNGPRHPR